MRWLLSVALGFSIAVAAEKPNVLLIVLDDMNGWSSRPGYPALQTPALNRLRAQSLNFVNAACNVTVCRPSGASFLSGLHASSNGAYCANISFADWNIGRVLDALGRSPHAANTLVIGTSDYGFHCGTKERWEKDTLWELSAHVPLFVRSPGVRPGRPLGSPAPRHTRAAPARASAAPGCAPKSKT